MRKIIHIDMDAFFASVEQRDNPSLRGKPIIVGGSPEKRGVVSAASYEARKFGIHSAMPTAKAVKLCLNLIIVKSNSKAYKEASQIIRKIFYSYTELVEPVSIDEAYLDVTNCKQFGGSATLIAQSILKKITEETELTASAGVSYNKFLAKYASDVNKPAGIFVILEKEADSILTNLPIRKFHGIGPATAKSLNSIGIFLGGDLKEVKLEKLQQAIGKSANFYKKLAFGQDDRKVKTTRVRKSIANEQTFSIDINDYLVLKQKLKIILSSLLKKINKQQILAKTITVKIKYSNFTIKTKSYTEENTITNYKTAELISLSLLSKFEFNMPIRLLGISFSNLKTKADNKPIQLRVFD